MDRTITFDLSMPRLRPASPLDAGWLNPNASGIRRRPLIAGGLSALGFPNLLLGQAPTGKVWRIGVLSLSVPAEPGMRSLIAQAMVPYGYEMGRNLIIDYKFAQEKKDQLPAMAAELLAAKPDLLIGLLNDENIALKRATSIIPIVMMYATAPNETGLVTSLARPGGNITGTTTNTPELAGKMTQLLRDTVPGLSRLTWLNDPDFPGMALYMNYASRAGGVMGLKISYLAVRTQSDLDMALAGLARDRPDAIGIATTGVLLESLPRVIEFTARQKLPALYSIRQPVINGGLMSYAADFVAMAGRNAWQIDKIFKGAKPSDIPVEEPAKFHLTINLKTARAMGLVIPQSVLLQATELIE